MPFQDIQGQPRALRIVRNALRNKCLPQAYLFYGIEGAGRFTLALSLAKALMCTNQDGDFCGLCSPCRRIAAEVHPDLYVVRPQSRKGGKDFVADPELGSIRIEQIRDLQRWIAVRSFESSWRVVIFDGAEKMNTSAANALLKTLEEPPPQSLLILVSPSRTQLLPTVVSRCQPVYFAAIAQKELEACLFERKSIDREVIPLIAAIAQGSLGKALAMDPEWVFNDRRQWLAHLQGFISSSNEERTAMTAFAGLLAGSSELPQILDLYAGWYKDLLYYSIGDDKQLINKDYIDEVARFSVTREPQEWVSRIEYIKQAKIDIQHHLNKQLVIEELLINLNAEN